jgi:hypothetical protein
MKNIVESQFGTFHTSETTTCPKCGKLVRWATSRLYDSDDDKFSNVVDKLMWHYENDKSCIREQKLKQLINE